jgi:DNA-binding CsgD family transcriptional regulator
MPKVSNYPDVARHGRVVRDSAALSAVPAACVGREPPALTVRHAEVLAKSLELDFVIVRFRDSNGMVATDFALGNACVALGDWLKHHIAEREDLSSIRVAPSTGDDAQGAAVLPESRLSWGDGRCAQSNCLLSETLTAREREILVVISHGSSNKRIARDLKISPETVKSHLKRIFMKLGVSTRTEAVCRAGSMGLLSGSDPAPC